MKLSQWLKKKCMSQGDFALLIRRSDATVSRIVRGTHLPGASTMLAVKVATKNQVMPNDFV
jgi:transcriptional regulator with XRE-family HTH domain